MKDIKRNRLSKLVLTITLVISCLFVNAQYDASTEGKIDKLISQMTLKEKISMIHGSSSFTSGGVPRLGIPELVMSDGPHGVRLEHGRDWKTENDHVNDSCTYLPTGIALGATWNPGLGYELGKVLGSEAKYRGKDVILGPGINILRTPLNGRNFEYLSEDPYLVSKMAVGYIKGVQDQGIAACVKHYLANNQETKRGTVNVEMTERTLREIYLPGFKAAVQEGEVLTLMGAYNRFRGQFCTHNEYLINKILKGELGFKGLVMSDWGAVHDTYQALMYGNDIEMGTDLDMMANPDYSKFFLGDTVVSYVKGGKVPESVVDDKVRRILRVMYKTNRFGKRTPGAFSTKEHQAVALKIAEEAIVLLKNENNILPLNKQSVRSIAVIGANATRKQAMGGGSSQVRPKYEITPLEGLQKLVGKDIKITMSEGFKVDKEQKSDPDLIREAVAAAATADVVIYVGGWTHGFSDAWNGNAFDAEGADKPDLQMPFAQDELIRAVIKANPNTIIVLFGGGPVDMTEWVENTKAIIQAWYPGMEGGTALAKIIFGETNPSGKLPMTFPKKLKDVPAHVFGEYPGDKDTANVHYREGIFVGYRYYDSYKVKPQFAFGHGLSYTNYAYKDISIQKVNKQVAVKLNVKNIGGVAGAEVVELYISDLYASVEMPDKQLKAFKKVFLKPGETKEVEFILDENAFSFFDEKKNQWVLESGKFSILAGSSSRDIRLIADLEL